MLTYDNPLDLVRDLSPDEPIACNRPERVFLAATWFQDHFPGEVLYAVKANPSLWVLDQVYAAGVRWFDVASLRYVELIGDRYPDANLAFMHPVKSRTAIARAYFDHGVRIFVLDCEAELEKIMAATGQATDLTLVVRMAVANDGATLPLAGKFGASSVDAPELLQKTRAVADELGVSFHVGSQCMSPAAYRTAMEQVSRAILSAAVTVDIVDVGGGFPVAYPGLTPPPLEAYMDVIDQAFEEMPVLMNADLWCEPGRALCAEGTSILAKVELVKDGAVHLNDGAYGNLFDAVHCKWPFPVRVHRREGALSADRATFRLCGHTCDSIDTLAGECKLHDDLGEGDYIEFGMLGAYGVAMQTGFNGFGATSDVAVRDMPWGSVFEPLAAPAPTPTIIPFPRRKRLRAARG